MVKAKHPKSLLHGSPVSASLAAAIMNGKYINAVPLYRLEQEFIRYGLAITRQNMANWMIRLGEAYLSVLYDHLHTLLYGCHVIHADELWKAFHNSSAWIRSRCINSSCIRSKSG